MKMTVCPECQDLDLWILGSIASEVYLSCRKCGHRWTLDEPLGPAFDDEQPTLFGTVAPPPGVFDAAEGDRRRDAGIARAAAGRPALLWFAKAIAFHLGRLGGVVCADHVQAELIVQGHDPEDLGNAAGAIFRDRDVWDHVGFRNSERVERQSGTIREWIRRDMAPAVREIQDYLDELPDDDEDPGPAWTQEDLDALDAAIAGGSPGPIDIADQRVEFRELLGDELRELRAKIEHEISGDSNSVLDGEGDVIGADELPGGRQVAVELAQAPDNLIPEDRAELVDSEHGISGDSNSVLDELLARVAEGVGIPVEDLTADRVESEMTRVQDELRRDVPPTFDRSGPQTWRRRQ